MEAVEVCVEVQENENGEIVYVEQMDNNSGSPENYCVMECEIETSENTSQHNFEETKSPVEIIVFPNLSNEFTQCVTNDNSETTKEVGVQNSYQMCLNDSELMLHRVNERYTEKNSENGDFDIVLNLAVRDDSDVESDLPVNDQFHEVKIIEQIPVLPTVEVHKSDLWSSLDNQDKTTLKQLGRTVSNSLDVRRTYSGISPRKTFNRSSYSGCFSKHPFRCKLCDQSFRQDSSLKIHLKVHAGKYSDNCIIN